MQAITIVTVPVGNAGNPADIRNIDDWHPNGIGAVAYAFQIGTTEVTNGQYVDFLNAVAGSDTYELWNENLSIVRTGSDGSYSYAVRPPDVGQGPNGSDYTYANKPVQFVSWYDTIRFTNWLHNGQPTGAQGPGTTEDGAYTIVYGLLNIVRNASARWWLPNEDEWYKAAYHKNDGVTGNYWDYPTATNSVPNDNLPTNDTGNSANFWGGNGESPLTDVGAYTLSASPYGTFDQGGNVFEWNETPFGNPQGEYRAVRGGSFEYLADYLNAYAWTYGYPTDKIIFRGGAGFRVATIPDLPGDFNHDDSVDADDLAQWQGDFGVNGDSDADNDHDSDGADFLVWQRQPYSPMQAVSASASIPEPETILLSIPAAAGWRLRRAQAA